MAGSPIGPRRPAAIICIRASRWPTDSAGFSIPTRAARACGTPATRKTREEARSETAGAVRAVTTPTTTVYACIAQRPSRCDQSGRSKAQRHPQCNDAASRQRDPGAILADRDFTSIVLDGVGLPDALDLEQARTDLHGVGPAGTLQQPQDITATILGGLECLDLKAVAPHAEKGGFGSGQGAARAHRKPVSGRKDNERRSDGWRPNLFEGPGGFDLARRKVQPRITRGLHARSATIKASWSAYRVSRLYRSRPFRSHPRAPSVPSSPTGSPCWRLACSSSAACSPCRALLRCCFPGDGLCAPPRSCNSRSSASWSAAISCSARLSRCCGPVRGSPGYRGFRRIGSLACTNS